MRELLHRLIADDRGQDLAEYGIALAVISVTIGLIATAIGTDVQTLWTKAQTEISFAAAGN